MIRTNILFYTPCFYKDVPYSVMSFDSWGALELFAHKFCTEGAVWQDLKGADFDPSVKGFMLRDTPNLEKEIAEIKHFFDTYYNQQISIESKYERENDNV